MKESARWMMEDDGRCEEATNSGRGSQVRWVNEVSSGMAMEEMRSNWSRDFDRWNLWMIVERISARWETGGEGRGVEMGSVGEGDVAGKMEREKWLA